MREDAFGKTHNNEGKLSMAALKRRFQASQLEKENKSKNTEKSQAKREIVRLKKDAKKPLAAKENIKTAIERRKKV